MKVMVARIYLSEGEGLHERIFRRLHDEEKVRGATVFRAISGFGPSGYVHTSGLLDLSLDLPVIIEFFDEPQRVAAVLDGLGELVKPGHVLTFPAQLT